MPFSSSKCFALALAALAGGAMLASLAAALGTLGQPQAWTALAQQAAVPGALLRSLGTGLVATVLALGGLVAKLIATSAKQIGMFLVILAIVSAAIVAFIIYTMTLGKIREIAVLKLIGTRNTTIASMILQQAMGLGLIGFIVGKVAATVWAPVFPKFVLLLTQDAVTGLLATMAICALASTLAIRAALQVDPAEAIG